LTVTDSRIEAARSREKKCLYKFPLKRKGQEGGNLARENYRKRGTEDLMREKSKQDNRGTSGRAWRTEWGDRLRYLNVGSRSDKDHVGLWQKKKIVKDVP